MEKEYYVISGSENEPEIIGNYQTREDAEKALLNFPGAGRITEIFRFSESDVQLCARESLVFWVRRLVFVVIGCFLLFHGIKYCFEEDKNNWDRVPAVLNIEKISQGRVLWTISGSFSYQYPEGGNSYTSSDMGRYRAGDVKALTEGDKYRSIQFVTCWVNPDKPEEAVLFCHPRDTGDVVNMCIFVVLGCMLILRSVYLGGRLLYLKNLVRTGKVVA